MYRLLATDLDIENFRGAVWIGYRCWYNWSEHETLWLWHQSQEFLSGQQLFDFQVILVRAILKDIVQGRLRDREIIFQTCAKLIQKEHLIEIESGRFELLRSLWGDYPYGITPLDSHNEGSLLISLLLYLGIDAQSCIVREIQTLEDGILTPYTRLSADKKIFFEQSQEGDWSLWWEWEYTRHESETTWYTVLSQYEAIVTTFGLLCWPFAEQKYLSINNKMLEKHKSDSRFQRRMAAKARKERVRTGKQQLRSKMPGSWNF